MYEPKQVIDTNIENSTIQAYLGNDLGFFPASMWNMGIWWGIRGISMEYCWDMSISWGSQLGDLMIEQMVIQQSCHIYYHSYQDHNFPIELLLNSMENQWVTSNARRRVSASASSVWSPWTRWPRPRRPSPRCRRLRRRRRRRRRRCRLRRGKRWGKAVGLGQER